MAIVQHLLVQLGYERWQDLALSAGNIFFCLTLIPMLRRRSRPPLLTCIPTGLGLLAGGFVFATLHLWFSALTQTIAGVQWLALACKKEVRSGSASTAPSEQSKPRTLDSKLPTKLRQRMLRFALRTVFMGAVRRHRATSATIAAGAIPTSRAFRRSGGE